MSHRLFRLAIGLICALGFGAAAIGQAAAERRVALIVGNANYEHAGVLSNTINDANAVAGMLTRAGFDVVDERRDVGVVEFKRAIREFLASASTADIAVVYYSGHGIEIGGVNYLIPIDAKLASDFDVDDEAIPLDRLIQATQSAKKLSLIILDACRDNPFVRAAAHSDQAKRSIGNRLTGVDPTGAGTLIAYAAKAGSVSYDGNGTNSPFTTALVRFLPEPGLDIRIALGKVRDEVMANTGNRQEPFVYGSLGGDDVALVPGSRTPKAPAAAANDPNAAIANDYALAERVGSLAGWQAFLSIHGSGYYASLARAQLAKLTPAAPPAANVASLDDNRGAVQKPSPPAAPKPSPPAAPIAIETAKPAPGDPCKVAAARLAQLRLDPDADQVAKFSRELVCEDLRPQVNRFMESLGLAPTPQSQVATAAVGEKSATVAPQDCKQAAAELARLRANPDRAAAVRFAHDLKCDDLKPQAARLLESLGD